MKLRPAVYAPILFGVILILVGFSARFIGWMGGISADPHLSVAIIQFLVFLLPLAFYGGIRGRALSSLLKFNGFSVKKLPFLAVMLGLMFAVILFCRYMGLFWFRGAMTDTPGAVYLEIPGGNTVLMLLCQVLLPALLEELLCRGILLEEYRVYGDGVAVCISAVLFAMLHVNPANLFFYFCLGLILGAATVTTGSLIPAVVMHALCNLSYFYLRRSGLEYVRQAGKSPLLPYILFALILLFLFLAFARLEDLYRGESFDDLVESRKELLYREAAKNKAAEPEEKKTLFSRLGEVWLSPGLLGDVAVYVLFAAGIL